VRSRRLAASVRLLVPPTQNEDIPLGRRRLTTVKASP
jgi:hypothetical protein